MLNFDKNKPCDVVAMGRSTVDMYPNETGPLEDAATFSKYLGGSSANTAVAMAKFGLTTGFIGKVSDDQFGRFVRRCLQEANVDISRLTTDTTGARTGMTIAEILSPTDCSFFVYRTAVADLNMTCAEIDEAYIAKHKAILISGTSLTHPPAREAVFVAMAYAARNNTRIVFDLDFREGTWKNREEASVYYTLAAWQADFVVGTREEFDQMEYLCLPGNTSDRKSVDLLFSHTPSMVAVKHGRKGSTIFTKDGQVHKGGIYPAKVNNTFGAGDSYMGALMRGILRGENIDVALAYAAAASSIVVSRHSCASSMPDFQELQTYMAANTLVFE